jgi:Caspase domain/Protein of unknown function (DUF1566)/PEGA domain
MKLTKFIKHVLAASLLLSIFASSTLFSAQNEVQEKRIALVIGNSSYENTPKLLNPRNDAMAIGSALKKLGFDVEIRTDLAKIEMDQAIRQFGEKIEGSKAALFFYAGHGIQINRNNYLLPIDAKLKTIKDVDFELTDLNLVLKQMEGSTRINLIFLDACRDNPMSQILVQNATRSANIGRGLAPVNASAGTLISYATKDGELALDGKGKHSPYTQALLDQIVQTGVEIGVLLRRVREQVMKTTDEKQVPWEYGSIVGEFYFANTINIQIHPSDNSSTNDNVEALFWQSIMNESNPAVFDEYLKQYPQGKFSGIASIKLSNLKATQKKDLKSPILVSPAENQLEYRLTINADPPESTIRILNVKTPYVPGMLLKPGRYQIEINREGYARFSRWIEVKDSDSVIPVKLKTAEKKVIQQKDLTIDEQKINRKVASRFVIFSKGIIKDSQTGLEWVVGPDKDMNWNISSSWANSLSIDDGRWRMPTIEDLKTLYRQTGSRGMIDPVFSLGASGDVWSGEENTVNKAWYFSYADGSKSVNPKSGAAGMRALAVRSGY